MVTTVFEAKLSELDNSIAKLRATTETINATATATAYCQARMLVLACESLRGALNEARAHEGQIARSNLDLICKSVTLSRSAVDHVKDLIDIKMWDDLALFTKTMFSALSRWTTRHPIACGLVAIPLVLLVCGATAGWAMSKSQEEAVVSRTGDMATNVLSGYARNVNRGVQQTVVMAQGMEVAFRAAIAAA
eukprot:m51a1_g2886 hypothetical protein (192) ;mRNA; r:418879-419591